MANKTRLELTSRQRRVHELFEDWAAIGGRAIRPSGYPSTSPQYAVQGMKPVSSSAHADGWRGRTSRSATGVNVRPAQTAYGRDSGGFKMPALTAPERAAEASGPITTIDNLFWTVLTDRQQYIIYARYCRGIKTHREIGAFLGLNRQYVSGAYIDILDLIGRLMFDKPKQRTGAAIGDVLHTT